MSVEDLRKGPGHYRTTPNPGQAGNAAIAGHRTTYGAPFHRVDELEPGDPIFVTTAQGVFEYRVLGFPNPEGGEDVGYFIVDPSDTWVLDQTPGRNLLTLTACHPKFSARQRIIVQAELVGDPAPTIPRAEAADFGPVSIDSGSADERANENTGVTDLSDEALENIGEVAEEAPAEDGDGEAGEELDETEAAAAAAAGADAADDDSAAGDDASAEVEEVASESVAAETADVETADLSTATDIDLAAAQTPFSTDDFGEGLNGDRTKIQPAILWGIATLFVWVTAWFVGGRLERKWTLYLVAFVPFLLVLWSTFVNVDQALPSY